GNSRISHLEVPGPPPAQDTGAGIIIRSPDRALISAGVVVAIAIKWVLDGNTELRCVRGFIKWAQGHGPGGNPATLELRNGSSIAVGDGSTLEMWGNGTIANPDGNAGRITVERGGLFQKDPGAGTARVDLPLDNGGTVDVGAGALDLRAGGQSSGNFTV